MRNTDRESVEICPYFISHKSGRISCEGIEPRSTVMVRFERTVECDSYLRYCCRSYSYRERCPIAIMLDRLQDDAT